MTWLPSNPGEANRLGVPSLVFQDAGAGNHIRAWMQAWPDAQIHTVDRSALVGAGGTSTAFPGLLECLDAGDWILVGTGRTSLPQEAMRLGNSQGKTVLAVVDHWVNYCKRFDSLKASSRPDAVVVTDRFAFAQVQSELPWATPLLWPNQLAEDLKEEVKKQRLCEGSGPRPTILILGEPTLGSTDRAVGQPEEWLLTSLPETLAKFKLATRDCDIQLRLHPSEAADKYDRVMQSVSFPLTVTSAAGHRLAEAIARADLVLGLTTYALFLAWSAGVPVGSLAEAAGLNNPFPSNTVPQLRTTS